MVLEGVMFSNNFPWYQAVLAALYWQFFGNALLVINDELVEAERHTCILLGIGNKSMHEREPLSDHQCSFVAYQPGLSFLALPTIAPSF